MPAAGQWVRGADTPVAHTSTNTTHNHGGYEWGQGGGSWGHNTPMLVAGHHAPFPFTRNQGMKIRRSGHPPGGRVAEAGTWTPSQEKNTSAPDVQGASKPSSHTPTPPQTSARCPKNKVERDREIKRKEEKAASLKRRRDVMEASRQTERAMEIHNQREAAKKEQEAAQVECALMESSVKLKEMRKKYEEDHKHEIAAQVKDAALKQRRHQEEEEQRKAIRRILKAHSHYQILMIPESSSLDTINKARRELSRLVHPDRCKLPGAQEAFVKITDSASALQAIAG